VTLRLTMQAAEIIYFVDAEEFTLLSRALTKHKPLLRQL